MRVVQALTAGPGRLRRFPRIGERLGQFDPREVRRLLMGAYEMRYEIVEREVCILRIRRAREER